MQAALRELADIDFRLADAILQLREQQELVGSIGCERTDHDVLLTLLSNVLRQFHRLEDHRNAVLEILSERTATLRKSCPTKHTSTGLPSRALARLPASL